MTKVTRQRKPTVAAQAAALPSAAAPAPLAAALPAPGTAVPKLAAKPANKPSIKPAGKSTGRQAATPADAPKVKTKLVRDSFTMPKSEYELLGQLKQRGTQLQRHVKKSELLRAGIAALHSMSDRNFLLALNRVPSLKTGRPKADAAEDASAD